MTYSENEAHALARYYNEKARAYYYPVMARQTCETTASMLSWQATEIARLTSWLRSIQQTTSDEKTRMEIGRLFGEGTLVYDEEIKAFR